MAEIARHSLNDANLVCNVQCIVVRRQSHIRLLLPIRPAQGRKRNCQLSSNHRYLLL